MCRIDHLLEKRLGGLDATRPVKICVVFDNSPDTFEKFRVFLECRGIRIVEVIPATCEAVLEILPMQVWELELKEYIVGILEPPGLVA